LVTDEEQVREMEFIDAATEYVHAEKRRIVALSKRGKRTCAEFDAIDKVYRCEKRLHALFCKGERSDSLNGMYNAYLKLLLNPPEPQA
jgi:hypothetical protein